MHRIVAALACVLSLGACGSERTADAKASDARVAATRGEGTQPTVRFLRDPIRIDGVDRRLPRIEFQRAAVKTVAQDWLPVLALEARVRQHCGELGCGEPEAARVVELMKLVEEEAALQARFPRFPKAMEAPAAACSFRLATCLARLERLLGSPSEDPELLAQRVEDALLRYAPAETEHGMRCEGATIDAREVWPALLTRSDVPWREARVREILTPDA